MDIHEYQAKALLREFGVSVGAGQPAFTPEEALAAARALPGPVYVVKAQIHAGGRGKGHFLETGAGSGGGVRIANSPDEVKRLAGEMLGSTLVTAQTGPAGKQVSRVYVEDGCAIAREFYLSMLVDRATSRVAIVVSAEGGIEIEEAAQRHPDKVVTITIDPATGVMPQHGRRVAQTLGLEGDLARQAGVLVSQLYEAFIDRDMTLLEINPLVVTTQDDLRCLDATISFDDNALFRQPALSRLRDLSEEDPRSIEALRHEFHFIALDGEIGCMVNGAGLAMATMDVIKLHGATPANFLDVGGGATKDRVAAAFKIITADPNVKGILVNIFGGIMRCDVIAEGVVAAVREVGLSVPLVVRLAGTFVERGKKIIADAKLNVLSADDLDDAARKIVRAVRKEAA